MTVGAREALAEKLFREGHNCAQSVFGAYAEDFGLTPDFAANLSCGLGGGVGRLREVCGAVTGATLVMGLRLGKDKATVYPQVQAFCQRFREEAGSYICRDLLEGRVAVEVGGAPAARTGAYYQKRPCVELVKLAVRLLEERIA